MDTSAEFPEETGTRERPSGAPRDSPRGTATKSLWKRAEVKGKNSPYLCDTTGYLVDIHKTPGYPHMYVISLENR